MKRPAFLHRLFLAFGLLLAMAGAARADGAQCQAVRLADIGWTDVTATTALTSVILEDLGYQPKIVVLSVPVTYAAMKNKDIDVFMGNWMPSQAPDRGPFVKDGSVEVVRANLNGAKYTLAVPAYTYAAGLHDFSDIRRFAPQLNNSIYGIEPGNDGNHHILDLIKSNTDGLGSFKLVESSEQGMLSQVERAVRDKQPIVFLAWEPHPMNQRFDLRYLTGGDSTFGPNYGGAQVFTNVRAGYLRQCPNVGRLLQNLQFTVAQEDAMMSDISDRHQDPKAVAVAWLAAHPEILKGWVSGVTTFDGRPALEALGAAGPISHGGLAAWVTGHKIPIGPAMADLVEVIKAHGAGVFDAISGGVHGAVDGLTGLLKHVPPLILILALTALAWGLQRSIPLSVFVALALLLIMNQGYWDAMLETLSLVLFSALISTLIGVPLGVAAAHRPWLYNAMHPVLDLMQTLPTFVYLIPTLVLFGLGVVPGLISTVIFALPAPVRLTHLGVSSTPRPLIEAGEAFGATKAQLLFKVELPSAMPTIIAGITQCIMLSLSMVVIAALVGAGGLGVPVVRALNTVQVGMGFEAGFAIVLLAIILDRMTRPRTERGAH
ncbi:choline ABC transporter permease subunit [Phenylobacterium montanum]|uniref:Choline ABC transporter permease subunit n=1 Tax=Phenylobacterium montanum TaxID=2823693 RepID=A0A975IVC0_9CAUL|nr:choline ABC transporter permease subunit [Caulobacter sp. S6]QUD88683.1 choline ABC transporter permease subunit [Caulobacter sp. S6]